MKSADFRKEATELLGNFEDFIEKNMPQKGNTREECQKVGFQIAIQEVYMLINGTVQSDLDIVDRDSKEVGDLFCPECEQEFPVVGYPETVTCKICGFQFDPCY